MQKKKSSMKKRIFALLLAAMMTLSSTVTAYAADEIIITDVEATQSVDTDATVEVDVPSDSSNDTTTETEPTEEYHYVSDLSGEGMLPYEYYIIDCSDIKSTETGIDLNNIPSYNSSQTKYNSSFAYDALSADEQEIYDSLYTIANTIDSSASYDATNMEDYGGYFFSPMEYADTAANRDTLYKAFIALANDNPQFFWIGHSYLSGSDSNGAYIYFGIDSDNFADGDARMEIKSSLYDEIEAAIEGAAAYGNEYSQEWYIHNYLCGKTDYVLDAEQAHNITGLLLEGEAVCESYAKCFQLFMNALGIDVMYITGLGNGGAHAWNQVGLDNNGVTEWYNVDVTWDDNDDGYDFYYFNAVDSDGTAYDFTQGFTQNGTTYNAHVPLSEGDDEYIYPAKICNSTTYSYENHSTNYKLASTDPVAKIGETEYASIGAAIEASTSGQTITLLADTIYTGTTMPEHELTIDCAGFCLEFDKGMDMNADLTIANLNGYDFDRIYRTGNVDLNEYEFIYLNDHTLTLSGEMENYLPVLISGYVLNDDQTVSYETGVVNIDYADDYMGSILFLTGVEELNIAENEYVNIHCGFYACDVTIDSGSSLTIDHGCGEISNLTIADDAWLEITSNDPDPFFCIYDTISANVVNVAAANMQVGLASVVTRLKYSVELFNFVYTTASGETVYKVSRMVNGDNIYLYMPYGTDDFTISDGNIEAKRCTFPEAVEWIDEQNNASKDYTITYTGDYTNLIVNNDLVFGNANSITFDGININLTGDITLNTDITFDYGGAFWGVLYGNDHTITFADNDTTSGFCGAYAENLNVVVLNSSVSFLDDSKSGNDIQLNTLTLNGDTDIGYSAVDKLTVDKLVISDINNSIIFNSGKAEIGDIICEGSCAFNIKNGDVLTVNGSTFDGNPIEFYSENPQNGQKLITVSDDISGFFTTYVQNANGDTYSVIYREGTLVLDIPVFNLQDVGIFSQWSDILSYINKNGSSSAEFTVELLDNVVLDSLTLPAATKAKAIDFIGAYDITLNSTTLSVPTNVTFDCALNAENTSITVAKGMQLDIADGNVKDLTGTATSTLCGVHIKTDSVKTFGAIDIYKLTVNETMSGVTNFAGELVLKNSTSPVTITNITNNSKISYQTGSTLPKVTVSNIANGKTLTINVNNGAALAGGTTVLYCTSDIAGKVAIENKTENGKALSPIYYASTKSIKAEDASAVAMTITDANGSTTERNFPTIELALAAVKDSTCDYTITLNQEFTLSALTLPKTAKSITFAGEALTFTGKTLSIPVNTTFYCVLSAPNTALTVAAKMTLTFGNNDSVVKSIKGTATSELVINKRGGFPVNDITTFNRVSVENGYISLSGKMTGVNNFSGELDTTSASCVVTIKNIEPSENNSIFLFPENGKLPKVTLTSFSEGATLEVTVFDNTAYACTVDSGTTILYTAGKDLSEHITIGNQTPEGKALNAFYYAKTKSIKAEWPGTLTLSYGDTSIDYPNIELALEKIKTLKNKTADYTIDLNIPLTLSALSIPTYANSITFTGEALTFTGKALKLPVSTTFNCELIAANTALTASKNLVLNNATLKSLAGAKSSTLTVSGTVNAPTVKTFASINAAAGTLTISGTASGITSFNGNLIVGTKAKINITTIGTSDVKLNATNLGAFGGLTVTKAGSGAAITVTVVDSNGAPIALKGGTTLFNCTSDISAQVTVNNVDTGSRPLSAFHYSKSKSIKAEWPGTLTLSYNDTSIDYPNIELALEKINTLKNKSTSYTIDLNIPLTLSALSIPTYANSITFTGEPITFTGKALKLPVSTIFECELIARNTALTASKNLGLSTATLKSLAGTKSSVLTVNGIVTAPTVKTFASINATAGELIVSGTASAITSFEGKLTASSNKTNITLASAGNAVITLVADNNGTINKLTINKAAANAAIAVTVVDSNGDPITLASGTPLFNCSSDISSYVTITNQTGSGDTLSASYYAKKKAIYAEYANAVAVSYSTANGDVNENYSSFEKAFAAIPLSAEGININLNCDVVAESFTVPKFVNGLTINGLVNTVTLKNLASVSLAVPATFNDVTINSTKSFKISTTGDLTLSSFASSTLSMITGKATGTLCYNGENDVNYAISGFGTLDLTTGPVLNISKAITVKNVIVDNSAILGIKKGANVKFTTVNSDGISSDELIIKYYDGATTPVSISGVITGNIFFTHETSFTDGQHLLTAAKADLANLRFEPENKPDERDFTFTRKSGKIYLKAIAFEVSDDTDNYRYADWADFVALVNAKNNAAAVYTVTLLGDHNVGAALTMPKVGTYSKIIIRAADEYAGYALTFTGKITLTGDIEMHDFRLLGVNARGADAPYTITTGKYSLTAYNTDFYNLSSMTGTKGSVITLADETQLNGKLNAVDAYIIDSVARAPIKVTNTLNLGGYSLLYDTVNAYAISGDADCSLVLKVGKLLTVGRGGTGENPITLLLYPEVNGKTKIGTITSGCYNDNFIGDPDEFNVVVEGNILYAYPLQ